MEKPLDIKPCLFRWNWLITFLDAELIQLCCKTPHLKPDKDSIKKLGTDVFLNLDALVESRRNLLEGKPDPACSSCWEMERKGVGSPRQTWQGTKRFEMLNIDSPRAGRDVRLRVEIVLDKVCNLECIYCGPQRSTRWQTRRKEFLPSSPPESEFSQLYWQWLEKSGDQIESITLSGGEPLLSPRYDECVDRMTAAIAGLKNPPQMAILSNLALEPDQFKQRLNKLNRLAAASPIRIEFSNESYGKKAEYIRYGLNWSNFTRNLETLAERKPSFQLAAQMANNCLSISTLADYLEHLIGVSKRHDIEVFPFPNYVTTPSQLDPTILTPEFSPYLTKARAVVAREMSTFGPKSFKYWVNLDSWLEQIEKRIAQGPSAEEAEGIQAKRAKFREYIDWLDSERGSSFLETFPEYESFYHSAVLPPPRPRTMELHP